jgi:glyoxylate/hydroxypyruvate reductase A
MKMIPFVHTFSPDRADRWVQMLNAYRIDIEVRDFAACSLEEREATEVAIVAAPSAEELRALPKLDWVQSLWAGVDTLVPVLPQGVDIVRMTDPNMARTMSESVLAWTLYLHRKMPGYRAQQMRREWAQQNYVAPEDISVAILGLGNMGQTSAQRLHENGYRVTGWSRSPKPAQVYACVAGADALDPLLAQSDIVVLLLPLTDDTQDLMNSARFKAMSPGSALVNFGRGGLVVEPDLLSALDGHLGHAVLDVFVTEPLPTDNAFWTHDKVTLLPHIAAETSIASAVSIAMGNITQWLDTGEMPETIDRARGY